MKVDLFATDKKYQIIYADPPWRNPKTGGKGRNNEKHYPSMSTPDICNLPISQICESNAILFLWACFPCLPDALEVINKWGFEYYGLAFDWCKVKADGIPRIGCGYYTRQNNEICLIGVKPGLKNRIKPLVRNICCSVLEPAREHSRKPDSVRDNIVRICGDIPRIELFARQNNMGWDCWGNQVPETEEIICSTKGQSGANKITVTATQHIKRAAT